MVDSGHMSKHFKNGKPCSVTTTIDSDGNDSNEVAVPPCNSVEILLAYTSATHLKDNLRETVLDNTPEIIDTDSADPVDPIGNGKVETTANLIIHILNAGKSLRHLHLEGKINEAGLG